MESRHGLEEIASFGEEEEMQVSTLRDHGWLETDPDDRLTFHSLEMQPNTVELAFRGSDLRLWVYRFEDCTSEVVFDENIVSDWPGEVCEMMSGQLRGGNAANARFYWVIAGQLSITIAGSPPELRAHRIKLDE